MSDLLLRPGVRRNYLVRRRVRFSDTLSSAQVASLQAVLGFNRVIGNGRERVLEYDASVAQIDALLQCLVAAGVGVDGGRLQRFRLGWYRYQDANISANAKDTRSSACSQSPLRFR